MIIPYSIDNHARSGICEGQKGIGAMRENNPGMYATDSKRGGTGERYVHFMKACWKKTTKTAHTEMKGESTWGINGRCESKNKAKRHDEVNGGSYFERTSQAPVVFFHRDKAMLLGDQIM